VVDRHPSNVRLFKDWTEVPCIQPTGTVTPFQMYVLSVPKNDQEQIFKYTTEQHSLQFQGSINTVPCRILLDTGASGTAFIDRQHCVKEGIVLALSPVGLTIVLAEGSRSA
jgi:predicted aspartyl protease